MTVFMMTMMVVMMMMMMMVMATMKFVDTFLTYIFLW